MLLSVDVDRSSAGINSIKAAFFAYTQGFGGGRVNNPLSRRKPKVGITYKHPQIQQFDNGFEQGERGYSRSLINTVRLLSAISMFSAMFAVIRFGSSTADGRLLIVLSVMTSLSGQLFVMQATKDNPKPWIQVPLMLLFIGIVSVGIAWILKLM